MLREMLLCYGVGIHWHWVDNNNSFLDYVSQKFSQSVKQSPTAGRMLVTEVDTKKSPKFKIEDEMKLHVKKLEHCQKEEHQNMK